MSDHLIGQPGKARSPAVMAGFSYWSEPLLLISSRYPAVMIPAGRATTALPIKADTIVISFPIVLVAKMSPYPTVVKEIVAH